MKSKNLYTGTAHDGKGANEFYRKFPAGANISDIFSSLTPHLDAKHPAHSPIFDTLVHRTDIVNAIPGLPKLSSQPKQMFQLSDEVLTSMTEEEVAATYNDMKELGIGKPPYEVYSIAVSAKHCIKPYDQNTGRQIGLSPDKAKMIIVYHIDHVSEILIMEIPELKEKFGLRNFKKDFDQGRETWEYNDADVVLDKKTRENLSDFDVKTIAESMPIAAMRLEVLLIVLLATKNVEKTVTHNRLARFGVGKQRAEYTTTLKIGKVTEHYDGLPATGRSVRPHLRRGHIRNQRHGPGNVWIKRVFVQPTFVNCDDDFVNSRTAYNVSMEKSK